jgi:hypothetical protein
MGPRPELARWVAFLSFAIDYRLWGLDPRGFHATNLAVHAAATLLLFAFVRQACLAPALGGSISPGRASRLALGAAALWALHPIQTQAVSYTVQRMTSLAAMLGLLSLVAFQRAERASRPGERRLALLVCLTATIAAMFTKQNAAVLPLLIWLYDRRLGRAGVPGPRRWRAAAPLLATLAVVPIVALFGGGEGGLAERFDRATRASTGIGREVYAATQPVVVLRYLGLMAIPVGQNVDHDVRWAAGWGDPRSLAAAASIVALFVAGFVWAARSRDDPPRRLVSFGLGWFLVALTVESSWLPIADPMVEHRLYLPSVGLVTAGAGLWASRFRGAAPRAAVAVLGLVLVLLAIATRARNEVWGSEVRLWEDALAKSPGKARVVYNHAVALGLRDGPGQLERRLRRVLELDPEYPSAHVALGRLALDRGELGSARESFERAARARPGDPRAFAGLSDVASAEGDAATAACWAEAALRRRRDDAALARRRQEIAADCGEELALELRRSLSGPG